MPLTLPDAVAAPPEKLPNRVVALTGGGMAAESQVPCVSRGAYRRVGAVRCQRAGDGAGLSA